MLLFKFLENQMVCFVVCKCNVIILRGFNLTLPMDYRMVVEQMGMVAARVNAAVTHPPIAYLGLHALDFSSHVGCMLDTPIPSYSTKQVNKLP